MWIKDVNNQVWQLSRKDSFWVGPAQRGAFGEEPALEFCLFRRRSDFVYYPNSPIAFGTQAEMTELLTELFNALRDRRPVFDISEEVKRIRAGRPLNGAR